MRELSVVKPTAAINVAAESRRETLPTAAADNRGNILPQAEWFAVMARELWQFKAANHLRDALIKGGDRQETSDRTCRAWTGGDNEPGARVLALLLRTEDGPRVLAYIMRGSDAAWWAALRVERSVGAAAIEAMQPS